MRRRRHRLDIGGGLGRGAATCSASERPRSATRASDWALWPISSARLDTPPMTPSMPRSKRSASAAIIAARSASVASRCAAASCSMRRTVCAFWRNTSTAPAMWPISSPRSPPGITSSSSPPARLCMRRVIWEIGRDTLRPINQAAARPAAARSPHRNQEGARVLDRFGGHAALLAARHAEAPG